MRAIVADALVTGGARMPRVLSRWNDWLFPELKRFPDDASRRAAASEFQARVGVFNWRFGLLLLLAIPLGLLAPWLSGRLQAWLPLGSATLGVVVGCGLFGLLQGALFATVINWSYRKPLQRFLRLKLNSLGVPTCLHCGYDTRGLHQPRCPECGRPFARGAVPLSGTDNSSES